MKRKIDLIWFVALAALLLFMPPRPVSAVIEIKTPMPKLYESASPVVVATVTKVIPGQNPVAECKTAETVKGLAFPDAFRFQIVSQPDAMKNVKAGDPLILLGDKEKPTAASAHFADAWWLIDVVAGTQPPIWRATPLPSQDEKHRTFPGRTEIMVKLVAELKAGKPTLLNELDNKRLRGGFKELANLGVPKASWIAAADVNGDKKPDLLVGTADGAVKLFLASAGGGAGGRYQDATAAWGLTGAAGRPAVFGDVNGDGKLDLLLGNTVWLNDGQKFAASKPPLDLPAGATVVATGLADVNGDTKPDALLLLGDGQLITFANPGAADVPWTRGPGRKLADAPLAAVFGDWGENTKPHVIVVTAKAVIRYPVNPDGGAPAEFVRLTGGPLTIQPGFDEEAVKVASAGVLDLNGDGRRDALILVDDDHGGVALVSRGFGAFFGDGDPAAAVTGFKAEPPTPIKATAATPWAAADLTGDGTDDLLLLAEDGRLFVVDNPPAGKS